MIPLILFISARVPAKKKKKKKEISAGVQPNAPMGAFGHCRENKLKPVHDLAKE